MKLNKLNDTAEHMERLTFVFCLVLLTVFIVIGFSLLTSMEKTESEIESVQNKITAIESSGDENKTLEQTHLNFIENEMVRHQDFIETQRQHLVWLISLIGAIGIFLLGFFGFRTRAEIQDTIAKQELDISESGINHYIGGNQNRQYLEKAIERERKAQKAQTLFLQTNYRELKMTNKNNQNPGEIYFEDPKKTYLYVNTFLNHLPVKEENTQTWTLDYEDCIEITSQNDLEIKDDITNKYKEAIEKILDGHDLVIYEIPNRKTGENKDKKYNEELEKVKNADFELCKLICNYCDKKRIYCIVYTNKGYIQALDNSFYTTYANCEINIIQTATTILNLMM
ncbi:hypothetical protein [Eubacterium sp. 1001713B170207_170306_E7]|uniref:hypothetical protein n=1 Tax=Eubacterium sp. 1001713B170207_170306_E7 TaxID=2787097 RepID=UPI001896DA08|nr:hypothetical protein [Eubacterium sp. 1001713B170207_170306_E7]